MDKVKRAIVYTASLSKGPWRYFCLFICLFTVASAVAVAVAVVVGRWVGGGAGGCLLVLDDVPPNL